jgi:hypothetical protein
MESSGNIRISLWIWKNAETLPTLDQPLKVLWVSWEHRLNIGAMRCFLFGLLWGIAWNIRKEVWRNDKSSGCNLLVFYVRNLHIFKNTKCRVSESDDLSCIAFRTLSLLSGMKIEHIGLTNLFTTLPWTLKLSVHFKMTLCKGILTCFGTWNSRRKYLNTYTVNLV